MKRTMLFAAIVSAPMSFASAETLDFNSAPSNMLFGPTYSEDGFTLTGTGFEFPQSSGWAYSTLANDGTLAFNYKGPTYTLTKDGGGTFDFTSFDLGNLINNMFGGTLRIAFDGAPATALDIPMTNDLTTYTFNQSGVSNVAFSFLPGETANNTLNSYARLDNIQLNQNSAVPEPASWAMLIGGFGLIGTAMRRRTRFTTVTA